MAFIHYKLITNQNFEKVTFDGVSMSVGELKKILFERKFAATTSRKQHHKRRAADHDFDLEITNLDTNEGRQTYIYKPSLKFKCLLLLSKCTSRTWT